MTSDIPKWCKVGYYIDAKDSMNEWCAAEVKEITKTCVNMILDGWAPKWETSVPLKSLKIAPFRKMSKGYTGPKTRGYRNWDFNLEVLNSVHEKVKSLIKGDLICEDAFQTTQYYRGKLFLYIDSLLSQKPSSDWIQPVLNFCMDVIRLIVKWLKSSSKLFPFYYQGLIHSELYLEDNNVALAFVWYELLDMLRKLCGCDPRIYEFFVVADGFNDIPRPNLPILDVNGQGKSKTAMLMIETFCQENGLEVILSVVRNEDEKSRVPFGFLNALVCYEIFDYLLPDYGINYFANYNELLLKRVDIISEAELKDLKYEEIICLINRMKKSRYYDQTLNFESLKLNFFLKMLKSGYLEKRIKALSEISQMIETNESKIVTFDQIKAKSNLEELKLWLLKENIVSLLLTDRPHVELMKRSSTVLKFFAKYNLLENSFLEQLWNSIQSKHDSYVRAAYDTIIDLSSVLNESQNDYLFSEFLKVPIENYDESFLLLIRDFTRKAISSTKQIIGRDQSKWYGVKIFQELMLDKNPSEFRFASIKYLVQILTDDKCESERANQYKIIRDLILSNNSVTQALKLFLKLIKHSSNIYNADNLDKYIHKVLKLKDAVIDNLSRYLQEKSDYPETSLQQSISHMNALSVRLQYLSVVAHQTREGLPFESLEILWGIFSSRPRRDKEIFFLWLHQGLKCKPPVDSMIICEMLIHFFLREDRFPSSCESNIIYSAFNFFFCEALRIERIIEITEYKQIRYRKTRKLKGQKKLLKIYLHTTSEQVMVNCGKTIFALMSRFDPDLIDDAEDIVSEFLRSIIETIQSSKNDEKVVMRALMLIQVLLDKPEDEDEYTGFLHVKKVHGKEFQMVKINQNKNLRHMRKMIAKAYGKEIEHTILYFNDRKITVSEDDLEIHNVRYTYAEVEFCEDELIEFTPFSAVSHSQEVIKVLFELLSDANKPYTDLAWRLLLTLPTCKSLKKSISQLKVPIREVIDHSSTHRLLYALKIVLKQSNDSAWVEKFSSIGGLQYILEIFTEHTCENSVKLIAFREEILVQILANILEEIDDEVKFVSAYFRSYEHVAKAAACGEKIEDEKKYFYSLKVLMSMIAKYCPQSLVNFLKSYSIKQLLTYIFIDTNSSLFVVNSIIIFQKLSKISTCFEYLYHECYILLEKALSNGNKSSGFWDLFSAQVQQVAANVQVSIITPCLIDHLMRRPSEFNSIHKDEILSGILKVLKSSWVKSEISPNEEHISLILQKCLCEIPEVRTEPWNTPPKCKHPETRSNGFELILVLCKINKEFLQMTTKQLDIFHNDPSWRTSRKADWNNSPMSKEKSQTGFVGLKNLGCTCYMNSILQQLFMIPTFKDSILRCPCEVDEENLLYQLQYIFSGLRSSDKQYINPKGFTKAFKDFEGNPINIIEQMDVDEFFGSFMDKLETLIKGTQYEELIKLHFGGLQVTELIGNGALPKGSLKNPNKNSRGQSESDTNECPHRSERYEPFLSISVDVKNKRSLQESLESYVSEEILEGENSYQCDHCEAKVKAIRRVCVKHLPNYLIIALRRFEFDFDTMTREKLNDYFEFPFDLNMEPYTQEGLDSDKEKKPSDYYHYRLRGIVIHTGTAESGHYYSYISSHKQWIEFNDTWVCKINQESIPNDCFGGEEKFQYNAYSKITFREKLGNAYMLFYERSNTYKPRKSDDESLEIIDLHSHELQEIEESWEIKKQNQKYWRSKIIFGPEYMSFVAGLASLPGINPIFLIKFFLTIIVRTKDKKFELFHVYSKIEYFIKSAYDVADWFLDCICREEVTKELFIFNPMNLMRRVLVGLVKTALKNSSGQMKVVFLTNLIQCLKYARKKVSKNYCQYLELVKMSILSIQEFSLPYNYISLMLSYLLGRPIGFPERLPHLYNDSDLGYKNYNNEELFKDDGFSYDTKGTSSCHVVHLLYLCKEQISEAAILHFRMPITMTQLIADSDNRTSFIYLGRLYGYFCRNDRVSSFEFLSKLIDPLKSCELGYKNKVLRILTHFLAYPDNIQDEKIDYFIDHFAFYIKSAKYTQENEYNISFLHKISCKIPSFIDHLNTHTDLMSYLEKWIRINIINIPSRNEGSDDIIKNTSKALIDKYERMKNKNLTIGWDSDEELKEDMIEIGKDLDIYDVSIGCWFKAKIEAKAGEVLLINYHYQEDDIQTFKDAHSEEVAPCDTKTKFS
ncbi:hypothetical protein SteCoe_9412 [Stentor coeruleus]|uniref:ubiquitinyl hydrolase 1 n=1 Tax=Stentor coeruleus TaxID=5963 RepID=A0A1R2CHW6_9CILI|nr:hypothetical protein SteCoe_9412 [Stentor coeruleus]